VRLGVNVGIGVLVGMGVAVAGMAVLIGMIVAVKGRAVSVNGSVGCGVTVTPGKGVGNGVRVATFGTQIVSPEYIRSLMRQLTLFNKPAVV
jgi:hypothetical protein